MKNCSYFYFSLFLLIWVLMLFQLGSTLLVFGVVGGGGGWFLGAEIRSGREGGKEKLHVCIQIFIKLIWFNTSESLISSVFWILMLGNELRVTCTKSWYANTVLPTYNIFIANQVIMNNTEYLMDYIFHMLICPNSACPCRIKFSKSVVNKVQWEFGKKKRSKIMSPDICKSLSFPLHLPLQWLFAEVLWH